MIEVNEEDKIYEEKGVIWDEEVKELNNSLDIRVTHLLINNFNNMPFEIIFHPKTTKWH